MADKEHAKYQFLKTYDSSEMYSYVMKQAWLGTGLGTGLAGIASYAAYQKTSWFKKYTNYPTRAFILFAGAATGFTLASDWAMVHYHRYMDRPDVAGFSKLDQQQQQYSEALQNVSKWEIISDWTGRNKVKLIGGAWALTISSVLYKDYNNPKLNAAAKFGHARIAAQFVTLAAVLAAFYFGEDEHHNKNRPRD